jgi:hypothetical protein
VGVKDGRPRPLAMGSMAYDLAEELGGIRAEQGRGWVRCVGREGVGFVVVAGLLLTVCIDRSRANGPYSSCL